jgi:hypothetical protein
VLGGLSQELSYGVGLVSSGDIGLDKPLTLWGITFFKWNQRPDPDLQVPSTADLGCDLWGKEASQESLQDMILHGPILSATVMVTLCRRGIG